jgi:sterol desaturase/sphingolipid hydroxylase (fatty acid hydroxylase superfamily)
MATLPLVLMLVGLHFGRYLLSAGGAWLFFFTWKRNPLTAAKRLQPGPFKREDVRRELLSSAMTAVLFGALFGVVFGGTEPVRLSHSGMLGALEFLGWLGVIVLIHDTYFYWSHRLLHHRLIFPRVHAFHHRSTNPSPFAALAFHPLEALMQVIWAVPLSLLAPIPSLPWLAFSFLAIFVNVLGHCGVEPYPLSWQRHPVLKWLNFATNHNRHHLEFEGNFGLYFSFWDRVMGTTREEYGEAP